jgi:hypothetical protein
MMTTLLILSFAFVGIFGFILFPILCWKWSASDAPLFAVSLVMALLYIFGLFNAFPFGIYFVFVLSILLTILAFMLTRKEFKQVLIRLFSPSFFLFILSFFFV